MQVSIAREIRARLDLYRQVFEHCRQGRFSFGRFLALVPDRLRLASGDAIARARIPAFVAEDVERSFARLIPISERALPRQPAADVEQAKRIVRLAQIDPELDPPSIAVWLMREADAAVAVLGRAYAIGLQEIGRGRGGEELAYLVHHLILSALEQALKSGDASARLPRALLTREVLELALRALSQGDDPRAKTRAPQPSLRLGLQLAITLSPLALGADAEELAARPLNAYRTTLDAHRLARRVIQEPIESIDLERVLRTIAERLVLDEEAASLLARETLLELIRDALLLILAQKYSEETKAELEPLRALASSSALLLQTAINTARRKAIERVLESGVLGESKAAAALMQLLAGADRVLRGELAPLGLHGDLEARAKTAALGAVVLALDERTESLRRDLFQIVHIPELGEREAAYQEGRAYRLAFDGRPLHRLPKEEGKAVMRVALAGDPPNAAGDALRALAGRAPAKNGDIVEAIELALAMLEHAEAIDAEQRSGKVPDVLGGATSVLAELDAELARLEQRLAEVDGAMRRLVGQVREAHSGVAPASRVKPPEAAPPRPPDPDSSAVFLADGKSLLEERIAVLTRAKAQRLAALKGRPLELSIFVGWGEALAEATGRSPWIAAERERRITAAQRALGSQDAPSEAFRVSIRRRHALDLPRELIEKLAEIAEAQDSERLPWITHLISDHVKAFVEERFESPQRMRELIAPAPELYNAGCAVTRAALEAYLDARRGVLVYSEHRLAANELSDRDRRRFLLDRDPERFMLVESAERGEARAIFRFAGTLEPPGRPAGGATGELLEVFELISPAGALGGLLFDRARRRTR